MREGVADHATLQRDSITTEGGVLDEEGRGELAGVSPPGTPRTSGAKAHSGGNRGVPACLPACAWHVELVWVGGLRCAAVACAVAIAGSCSAFLPPVLLHLVLLLLLMPMLLRTLLTTWSLNLARPSCLPAVQGRPLGPLSCWKSLSSPSNQPSQVSQPPQPDSPPASTHHSQAAACKGCP